jgi:hypothetical protein
LSIVFALERTNQLSLLPDKDLIDLCPPIEPDLVVCQDVIDGYNLFNLIRASSVVNRQSTGAEFSFLRFSQVHYCIGSISFMQVSNYTYP